MSKCLEYFFLVFFAIMFFVGLAVWLLFIGVGLFIFVLLACLHYKTAYTLGRNIIVTGDQVAGTLIGQGSDMTISGAVGQALYYPGVKPRFPKFIVFAEWFINKLFFNSLWMAEDNHIWNSVEYTETNAAAVFKLFVVENKEEYEAHIAKITQIEKDARKRV